MRSYLLGLIVALLTAGGIFLAWKRYEDFLNQGRRPPDGINKLLSIETDGIPKIDIVDLNNRKFSLGDYAGKVVIVNFWASWCEPCVKEFPSLMSLLDEFKGKVVLIAVSGDYEREDIDVFLKAFKVNSPHIHITWDSDQAVAKQFGTYKLPESYIFGPKGEFIRKIVGVDDWATPDAFEFFRNILAGNAGHSAQEK